MKEKFDGALEAMDPIDYRLRKRWILLWLMLVTAVDAGVGPLVESSQTAKAQFAVFGLITGLLILRWCSLDSVEWNTHFGPLLGIAIVFFTIIGVPIYLLRTRGLRGLLAICKAALFVIMLAIIAFVSEQLVEYIALALASR